MRRQQIFGRGLGETFVPPAPAACLHCGCTERHACLIPIAKLDVQLLRRVVGREMQLLGSDTIACWWVSLDPPICSNPTCVKAQITDTMLVGVSRIGA